MTDPLPAARRGQHRGPWTIDDDALVMDFLRESMPPTPRGGPSPAAIARAAELITSLGRTASAIDTRIRALRDRGRGQIRADVAARATAALRATRAGEPPRERQPRPPAQTPRAPPAPLPALARQGRDYGPRPACAPPRELWADATGDGIDPWRVAHCLRSAGATAEAIAGQLAARCDPRSAPRQEVVHGRLRGVWSAANVRALLGE